MSEEPSFVHARLANARLNDEDQKNRERAMIKYALAQGYELVNDRGTKTAYDEIQFSGNRDCTRVFGASMHLERR